MFRLVFEQSRKCISNVHFASDPPIPCDNGSVCARGVKQRIKRKKGRKLNRACHRYRFHASISRASFTDTQWSVCVCICGINLRKRYFYLPPLPPSPPSSRIAELGKDSCHESRFSELMRSLRNRLGIRKLITPS